MSTLNKISLSNCLFHFFIIYLFIGCSSLEDKINEYAEQNNTDKLIEIYQECLNKKKYSHAISVITKLLKNNDNNGLLIVEENFWSLYDSNNQFANQVLDTYALNDKTFTNKTKIYELYYSDSPQKMHPYLKVMVENDDSYDAVIHFLRLFVENYSKENFDISLNYLDIIINNFDIKEPNALKIRDITQEIHISLEARNKLQDLLKSLNVELEKREAEFKENKAFLSQVLYIEGYVHVPKLHNGYEIKVGNQTAILGTLGTEFTSDGYFKMAVRPGGNTKMITKFGDTIELPFLIEIDPMVLNAMKIKHQEDSKIIAEAEKKKNEASGIVASIDTKTPKLFFINKNLITSFLSDLSVLGINQKKALIESINALSDYYPDYVEAEKLFAYAMTHYKKKEFIEAIKFFNDSSEIDIVNENLYRYRGDCYFENGNYQNAIEDYTQYLSITKTNGEIYFKRGICNLTLGMNLKALNDFDEALSHASKQDQKDIHFNRGLVFKNMGELDQAVNSFCVVISLEPENVEAHVNRGVILYEMGKIDKAIQDFEKAIELDPKNTKAYYSRGKIYQDLKKIDKAKRDFDKAIEADPANAHAYYARGSILFELGDIDAAKQDFDKTLELDTDNADAYYARGVVYHKMEGINSIHAIDDFNEALKRKPTNSAFLISRGKSNFEIGEYAKAIQDLDKVIEEYPDKTKDVVHLRAQCHYSVKDYKKAFEDYNKLIEFYPDMSIAYFYRAKTRAFNHKAGYIISEDRLGAITDFTKAIELDNYFLDAYYERGKIYWEMQKYEKAADDYSKAIALGLKTADVFYARGYYYDLRTSDRKKALSDYNSAIALNPYHPNAYGRRAEIYNREEKYQKAADDYDKHIKINNLPGTSSHAYSLSYLKEKGYIPKDNGTTTLLTKSEYIKPTSSTIGENHSILVSNIADKEQNSMAPKEEIPNNYKYIKITPSFDCNKATTKSEKLICSDPNLSNADKQLAEIYVRVLEQSSNQDWLKKDQLSWMKHQRDTCKDVPCMLNAYKDRINELDALLTSEYFKVFSPALAAKIQAAGHYFKTSGDSIYRKFCIIKQAIKSDQRELLSCIVAYPIKVTLNSKKTVLTSRKQFVENYQNIITPQVKSAVDKQEFTDIFFRDSGLMFGQGEIWLNENAIIAINN